MCVLIISIILMKRLYITYFLPENEDTYIHWKFGLAFTHMVNLGLTFQFIPQ